MSQALVDATSLISERQPAETVEELLAEAEASLDQAYRDARRMGGSDRSGCIKVIALLAEAVLATKDLDYDSVVHGLREEAEDAGRRLESGLGSADLNFAVNRLHGDFLTMHVANGRRERAAPGGTGFIAPALQLAGAIAAGLDAAAPGNLLRGNG